MPPRLPTRVSGAPGAHRVIVDRESPRFQPLLDAFQREVQGFFRPGEITLLPPTAGDGTAAGPVFYSIAVLDLKIVR